MDFSDVLDIVKEGSDGDIAIKQGDGVYISLEWLRNVLDIAALTAFTIFSSRPLDHNDLGSFGLVLVDALNFAEGSVK